MAGPVIHRMMHTVFHTNKRVQQETHFRDGAASVSYAAAELAAELTVNIPHPRVLVVGLGEMGRDVAKNLDYAYFSEVVVCNRSHDKAIALAAETGASVLAFADLPAQADSFDAIISAVSGEKPLFVPAWFTPDGSRSRFMLDLGMPRSISPELEAMPGTMLYNIDDINTRTERTLERRRESIPGVKAIIVEEMSLFDQWSAELSLSPTIQRMKEALEQIRKDELARYLRTATPKEAELLEAVSKGIINKVLKMPVIQLREACKRGEHDSLIGALNDLFNLEGTHAKAKA